MFSKISTTTDPANGGTAAWTGMAAMHLPTEDPDEPDQPHRPPPPQPADEPPPVPEGDPPSDAPPERAKRRRTREDSRARATAR